MLALWQRRFIRTSPGRNPLPIASRWSPACLASTIACAAAPAPGTPGPGHPASSLMVRENRAGNRSGGAREGVIDVCTHGPISLI